MLDAIVSCRRSKDPARRRHSRTVSHGAVQLKETLEEQVDILRKMDKDVLKLLVEIEEVTDD